MDACFYWQLHQPYRLRRYRIFDIGAGASYFDQELNRRILNRVVERSYAPAIGVLQRLVDRGGARFALGMSDVLLEQLRAERPGMIESLQRVVATGRVEVVGETSHHSLAFVEPAEFDEQVKRHGATLKKLFGVVPRCFRNTELIVDDELLARVGGMGFDAVLVEGADHVMQGRAPTQVYGAASSPKLRLLPRHYRLSDDVAFRFTDRNWGGWPLTAEKYAAWIAAAGGDLVNVFMDLETFGEHHDAASGIFDFLLALPAALERHGVRMVTPSDAARRAPAGTLFFPNLTSWADTERDTSAWLGNKIQRAAHERIYELRDAVLAANRPAIVADWRRLTTSDHFYYMSTKWRSDGDVHTYFTPHSTPYDAYISFMNVARDLEQRLAARKPTTKIKKPKPSNQSPTTKPSKPKTSNKSSTTKTPSRKLKTGRSKPRAKRK